MEVEVPIQIAPISTDDFARIDSIVMKCAYASHNHFGNLCDERVYESDLAMRLRSEGIRDVSTQVSVTISFREFKKDYRLDVVVEQMVYELKAENSFSSAHDAQAIQYAAILGLNRIKLINFGGESVKGRLLGTPFTEQSRQEVSINREKWHSIRKECHYLADCVEELTRNIGGYLSPELYREALLTLLAGDRTCTKRLPVLRDEIELGTHHVSLHADDCAFFVTSLGTGLRACEKHLHLLLTSLPLKGIQWINIHNRNVQLVTIT